MKTNGKKRVRCSTAICYVIQKLMVYRQEVTVVVDRIKIKVKSTVTCICLADYALFYPQVAKNIKASNCLV